MTKDEALKMAIEALDDLELCDYATAKKAIQACKEALEPQEVGDAEIKQMLNDIDWYQMRVKELEEELEALEQPARLVSYAPDKSTCTLNIDGEEVYFNREQLAQEPVAWISESTLKHSEEYVHESRS